MCPAPKCQIVFNKQDKVANHCIRLHTKWLRHPSHAMSPEFIEDQFEEDANGPKGSFLCKHCKAEFYTKTNGKKYIRRKELKTRFHLLYKHMDVLNKLVCKGQYIFFLAF